MPQELNAWRTVPRSKVSGFCVVDNIFGWVSATDPTLFAGADDGPFSWVLLWALLAALGLLLLLGVPSICGARAVVARVEQQGRP